MAPSGVRLFSAYAEVFLSPRARSLFRGLLFSAYAEVFPAENAGDPTTATFLCLRRGVSDSRSETSRFSPFSLPTQRCFRSYADYLEAEKLFSAYAEVFLKKKPDYIAIATFLCLRRGVSNVLASK